MASEQVNTPDANRSCFYGQQILIKWHLPFRDNTELFVHIRFGTKEITTLTFPIAQERGFWIYRLMNADYDRFCGIVSFKVDLFHNGNLVEEWRHHIWTDLIEIGGG